MLGLGKKTYRFSVLFYEPDLLGSDEAQPVAVVVTDGESVYMMGIHPENVEATSDLGRAVLERLPHVLMEQLHEALEAGSEDVLGYLASHNQWNLYLSEPERVKEAADIQTVGFKLFLERVARFYRERVAERQPMPVESPFDNIFIREAGTRVSAGGTVRA